MAQQTCLWFLVEIKVIRSERLPEAVDCVSIIHLWKNFHAGVPNCKKLWFSRRDIWYPRAKFWGKKISVERIEYWLSAKLEAHMEQGSPRNAFIWKTTESDRVAKGGEIEASTGFFFPQLSSLQLHCLPELRTFYPGIYTIEGPFLKSLGLHYCDNVEVLTSDLSCYITKEGQFDIPTQLPLFLIEKVRASCFLFKLWTCRLKV